METTQEQKIIELCIKNLPKTRNMMLNKYKTQVIKNLNKLINNNNGKINNESYDRTN